MQKLYGLILKNKTPEEFLNTFKAFWKVFSVEKHKNESLQKITPGREWAWKPQTINKKMLSEGT